MGALTWLTCCAAPTVAKTGSNAGSIDTPHASFGNAAMASLQEAPAQPPSEAFTEELAAQLLEKYKLWQQQMSSLVASVGCRPHIRAPILHWKEVFAYSVTLERCFECV